MGALESDGEMIVHNGEGNRIGIGNIRVGVERIFEDVDDAVVVGVGRVSRIAGTLRRAEMGLPPGCPGSDGE